MTSNIKLLLYSPLPPIAYARLSPKGYRYGWGSELSSECRRAWWNLYWLSDPTVDWNLDDEETWMKRPSNVKNLMPNKCAKAVGQKLGGDLLGDLLLTLGPADLVERIKGGPHSHLYPYKYAGKTWLKTIEKRSRLFPGVLSKEDKVVYANFGIKTKDVIAKVRPSKTKSKKTRTAPLELKRQASWLKLLESVPLTMASGFIKSSAWWLTHSSGSPQRAHRYSDRIYESEHGWAVDYGASSFLVGKAIERCAMMLNEHIVRSSVGRPLSLPYIKLDFQRAISGAVAKKGGAEFLDSYPIRNGNLEFGAQAINMEDAVDFMISELDVASMT